MPQVSERPGAGLADVLGNEEAMSALKLYADEIDAGVKRKPVLVSGPSGTGKSMAAHAVAEAHGWHVVELNASDYRDQESIDKIMLAASQSRTIFGSKNLVLLDEIDELAPKFDTGASSAISNLMAKSRNPIILIANNRWNQSISFLRAAVDNIDFKKLAPATIMRILEREAGRRGIKVDRESMDVIANRSNGDARSALNDLMVMDMAPKDTVDAIGLRDRKTDIFMTLDKIFMSHTVTAPMMAASNSDVENDMLIKWIDENISKRYVDAEDLKGAYEMLAKATTYQSRASRAQYYTYWRYMSALMSSGVALSKSSYPNMARRYTFPKMIMELSRTKDLRGTGLATAKKLKGVMHDSIARIMNLDSRTILDMARAAKDAGMSDDDIIGKVGEMFNLADKEAKWLIGKGDPK